MTVSDGAQTNKFGKMNSSSSIFLDYLKSSTKPLLSDGGMGTMLNSKGIGFERCLDELNLTDPNLVREIHQAYIDAGSEIIQTNTFGANRYKLSEHDLGIQVTEINRAGAAIAQQTVSSSGKDVFVAGDIGPLGVRMAPYGRVQKSDAFQVFKEQVEALCDAGVDLIILETISDLEEMLTAIKAVQEICALPIVASMTFTRDDRTMLGDTPGYIAENLYKIGVDLIGVNCSGGPSQILRILCIMQQAAPKARFSAMPNAGFPEQVGGRFMYPATPEYFREFSQALQEAGACLVGGCCGTTPAHIAEMRYGLDNPQVSGKSKIFKISVEASEMFPRSAEEKSGFSKKLDGGDFVISVEMDPPRGLSTHKLLAAASLLAESGVDVINIADSPMARMRMSPWAVCNLVQQEVGIETVLHFPTRGRNLLRVQGDLLAAHAMEIKNIFVVMGDPTAIGDYPEAMDDFDLVPSGLIHLIKCGFNLGKDHSGGEIGQPTSFFVGCALNLAPRSVEKEIKVLHRKIKSGVDFILTQPVFDPRRAAIFLEDYAGKYGELDVPILVGVLPLFNHRHALFLDNEVPGISIPEQIMTRISQTNSDPAQEGLRIAVDLIEDMRSFASGIYLMPQFNRYDLAVQVVDQIK